MILKKVVDVYPSRPVHIIPPIRRTSLGIILGVGDIRTCLCSQAIVEERLDNGTTIRLNFSNYDKNNNKDHNNNVQQPVYESNYTEPVYTEQPVQETVEQYEPVQETVEQSYESQEVNEQPVEETQENEQQSEEESTEDDSESDQNKRTKRRKK